MSAQITRLPVEYRLACEFEDEGCHCTEASVSRDGCIWAFGDICRQSGARDEVFPAAYIKDGPELDRALESLGLTLAPEPPTPTSLIAEALLNTCQLIGMIAIVWGAVQFVLGVLEAVGPAGVGR
jgi:hypothetical protein